MGRLRSWLFDPVPAHSLVILRIGLGAVLVAAYLMRWPLVDVLYGPEGYAGADFHARYPESEPVGWPLVDLFGFMQRVESGAVIWTVYLGLLASALGFTLGAWPRVTGTLALLLHSLLVGRNPGATWGWATMIKPFLAYAILASTGGLASILTWLRRRRGAVVPSRPWVCPAWPLRLLQVHITCVFLALWARVDEGSWLSGQMLPVALTEREFARFDVDWAPYFPQLEILGIAILVLELGAPLALWIPVVGRYWALAMMGMFAALVVTTSVGWWDFMMLFALSAFLPAAWLGRIVGPRASS